MWNASRLTTAKVTLMTAPIRKFLVFSLQDSLYALDLKQVAEVDDPPQMWPIPLAPACYCGALNFHGDIVAVLNLALFLELPGAIQSRKIVILNKEIASIAFLVDKIVGIVSEQEVSISKPPENCFAAALLTMPDGEAVQLDLEALALSAEISMQKN